MSILDTIGPTKGGAAGIIPSEVLMREAVRGLTERRPKFSGDIGRTIAFLRNHLQSEHVVANNGLPFFQEWVTDKAYEPMRRRCSTGIVEIDPGILDGFDLFMLLMHFDSDQAKDLNYVGFSKSASPVAHTIYALLKKGYSVDRDTMVTLKGVIDDHLKQAARHLAEEIDLDPDQIEVILRERRDIWSSPRILAKITNDPTHIENLSHLFAMGDSIQVHMGKTAPRIGKMLAEYQKEILADETIGPLARRLYAQRNGRKGSGKKMFNGKSVDYDTVLFPLHPTVAKELIEHLEAYDPNALIDHSVRMLAQSDLVHGVQPTPGRKI